jgi:hypothetical protein
MECRVHCSPGHFVHPAFAYAPEPAEMGRLPISRTDATIHNLAGFGFGILTIGSNHFSLPVFWKILYPVR